MSHYLKSTEDYIHFSVCVDEGFFQFRMSKPSFEESHLRGDSTQNASNMRECISQEENLAAYVGQRATVAATGGAIWKHPLEAALIAQKYAGQPKPAAS